MGVDPASGRRCGRTFGVVAVLCAAWVAQAATPASLLRPLAGAEVDWSEGTITATAGAAADMRMPSVDSARPGAERRARAAALEKLRTALKVLPMGAEAKLGDKEIDLALTRASAVNVEYQSNGGVVLGMRVKFEDFVGGKSATATSFASFGTDSPPHQPPRAGRAPVVTSVVVEGAMGLQVWPPAVFEGKEIVLRRVRYRMGTPPKDAIQARRDGKGRLLLAKGIPVEQLVDGVVVIYVQKVAP